MAEPDQTATGWWRSILSGAVLSVIVWMCCWITDGFFFPLLFSRDWFVQLTSWKCHAESQTGDLSECFWRNIYRIFHCGIYTQRVAGFHALEQHITASAVDPYKETGVSVGKMCHFSSFRFSLLLTTLPHRLLASVELKRSREQLCKKRNFQTTQVKLFTLTLPVSLISFPQHSEVQSQPPCVNSAGALAPADNSTKDFHQSESLMALFEGDIKKKKKKKKNIPPDKKKKKKNELIKTQRKKAQ